MSDEVEAIKASDLVLLMKVVEQATGLYNALERERAWDDTELGNDAEIEYQKLGESLRALGLQEAT